LGEAGGGVVGGGEQSKTGGGTFRSLRANLLRKYIIGIVLLGYATKCIFRFTPKIVINSVNLHKYSMCVCELVSEYYLCITTWLQSQICWI
jgi:hypothetical protein